MRPFSRCVLAALLLMPVASGAQSSPRRTTLSGIYTAEQAIRGKDVYAGMCQSCHTAASHTGPVFVDKWNGRSLAELFTYITENMPKSEPGSLSTREYVLVLAYMLRVNGMPVGREELRSDPEALGLIRLEWAASSSSRIGLAERRVWFRHPVPALH
jgi:mono/diheme cytochrome c family protein